MAFDPLTAILNIGTTVIDRLIPDKTQAAQAKAQLVQLQVGGELDELKGQLAVNAAEAVNQNVFVSGWRPFVGWACGLAFVYAFIVQPMAQFTLVAFKVNFDISKLPTLDLPTMMPVLLGMLGLGAMRSWDKNSGTGNGH